VNSRFTQLINATDSLYLTPPQQKDVLEYAKSLPRRFAALRSVEELEVRIIDLALEKFSESQPTVGDPAEAGWDSASEDLRHALRTVALGLVMDDGEYADGAAIQTLRTILNNLDWPGDAGADLFESVKQALSELLPADAAAVFLPYWDEAAASMAGELVAA
jgi:hypothetical protein